MSYSFVAHRNLDFCNPMGEAKVELLLRQLDLPPGRRAIDFGAGKAELCLRIIEAYRARATAVDDSPEFCAEARQRGTDRGLQGRLKVVEGDAGEYLRGFEGKHFDVGICFGSTHAFRGYRTALAALQSIVVPHGLILLGEGYWKQPPAQGFLDFLGGREDDLQDHAQNVQEGVERGLVPIYATTASEDETDDYEWSHAREVEAYAQEHPADPEARAWLERSRGWRDAYLKWGRDTLGFGAYLFRNG